MPTFIIYLIKANIALTLFYLAYRFGLRRLTFYNLNRFFLLFGIAFSALFPLVNINTFFQQHEQLAGSVAYYTPDWSSMQLAQPQPFTVWSIIQYVFWGGVAVMTIRLSIQLLSLLRIHIRTKNGIIYHEKVKIMYDRINPFSFFKSIYINPALHSPQELEDILKHEKIHVKGWHTADVLAGEINNIFYWFNPGAWLMKTAIQENLEFITDRKILQSGTDAKAYQYNLIKVSTIPFAVPVANNFNFSHLKRRIKMMNKKKSSGFHLLRYILLLPLVAIVVIVTTSSKRQNIPDRNKSNKIQRDLSITENRDSIPLPYSANTLPTDYQSFLKRNPSVKSLEWFLIQDKGPALIHIQLKEGKIESYHLDNPQEMKKAETKYGKFPAPPAPPPPAPKKEKPTLSNNITDTAKNGSRHVLSVTLVPTSLVSPQENTVKWDDKFFARIAYKAAQQKHYDWAENYAHQSLKLNPDNAKAKSVLRYVQQMKSYQSKMEEYEKERGNNPMPDVKVQFNPSKVFGDTSPLSRDVLENPAKKANKFPLNNKILVKDTVGSRITGITIYGGNGQLTTSAINSLLVVDDKIVDAKYINKFLRPQNIYYVGCMPGKKGIKLYGDKGKNGVIQIYTKEYVSMHPSEFRNIHLRGIKNTISNGHAPANGFANESYDAAMQKNFTKATIFTNKSLAIDPDNAMAKQVLRYVMQMKGFQEKMEEYEKEHKNMDSTPAHALNYNFPINNHGLLSTKSSESMLLPGQHYSWTIGPNNTLNKTITETGYKNYLISRPIKGRKMPSSYTYTTQAGYVINDTGKLPAITLFPKAPEDQFNLLPENVLYIVNGKKVNRKFIQQLNPNSISSISVLKKDKAAILEYGPAAKEGVIKIYTKEYAKPY